MSGKIAFPHDLADGVYTLWQSEYCPVAMRSSRIFLVNEAPAKLPDGYAGYLSKSQQINAGNPNNIASLPPELLYLQHGDIVSIRGNRTVRFLIRPSWDHNSILLTERCNHYCLMCSQPPKDIDDTWILSETFDLIKKIPKSIRSLGFTGGEPTLYGNEFLSLIDHCKHWLPYTGIHVLSNGRTFSDNSYSKRLANIDHPDLMFGIPVYSCDPSRHDYIVQSTGAFDETIRGILNLKENNQRVEIRVVLHKQSIPTLTILAEYICRNLLFVDQVALMGLEMTGFTRANLEALWIDPVDYKDDLSRAVDIFCSYGVRVMVFNHQLCTVNKDVRDFCVKSISEWKNEYAPECKGCSRSNLCGGFFSSGIKHGYSKSIRPFID